MPPIRQGKVTTPHKRRDTILLTRMDGSQLRIPIEDIEYWAESTISHTLTKIVVVHYAYSAICVRETFDAIDAEVNGKAVQP